MNFVAQDAELFSLLFPWIGKFVHRLACGHEERPARTRTPENISHGGSKSASVNAVTAVDRTTMSDVTGKLDHSDRQKSAMTPVTSNFAECKPQNGATWRLTEIGFPIQLDSTTFDGPDFQ